jgi:hypothetical protein
MKRSTLILGAAACLFAAGASGGYHAMWLIDVMFRFLNQIL